MHYYQFNIGDYASATAHLEPIEDLAYRRMLDLYYSSEKPIPADVNQVARLIRMRTHCDAIAGVLREFFVLENDGWHCERVDVEIFKYLEKSQKASKSAKARWRKQKKKQKDSAPCEGNANALKTQCEGNANHKPRTINQEPNNSIDHLAVIESCFERWWKVFPTKTAKKKALGIWTNKLTKNKRGTEHIEKLTDYIVMDIETKLESLANGDKKYFGFDGLHATTYLNQERWNDE